MRGRGRGGTKGGGRRRDKRTYFSCVILCFGGDCYATKVEV